jgi:hypothetical protein
VAIYYPRERVLSCWVGVDSSASTRVFLGQRR